MHDLNLSLLREKFIIHDPQNRSGKPGKAVTALSNRITLNLVDRNGRVKEDFVIRTQNMHSCARMAARMLQAFETHGSLLKDIEGKIWPVLWESALNDYEAEFNTERWIVLYHKGKTLFKQGEHHPLLDVIEKCHAANEGAYEEAVPLAEDAFKKTGKSVRIEYDGNVALVVNMKEKEGRFGIILRSANRTTTFNFTAAEKGEIPFNQSQCLSGAAAFLEGMQLAFTIGMNNIKIQMGIIERLSKEEKANREAKQRLAQLSAEISNLERGFSVRYRPEKPEFDRTISEAEKLGLETLRPAPKKR